MIRLLYDATTQSSDFSRPSDGNIETDELLDTAVFISIFSRRRALDDDDLPDPDGHREGWWADTYPDVDGDKIGSRLWLLRRSKTTQATMNKAKNYIEESLKWMVDDGIASSINVIVERQNKTRLAFKVEIYKPTTPASKWVGTWQAHLEQL